MKKTNNLVDTRNFLDICFNKSLFGYDTNKRHNELCNNDIEIDIKLF